jgi:hypothetical protein
MGLELADLESKVRGRITDNKQIPFEIPYTEPSTCLLALPDGGGCKGGDSSHVAKFCELRPVTNASILASAIRNGFRSDTKHYKFPDISCAFYDKKPKSFPGAWLDFDSLIGAHAERNIASSSNPSSENAIKANLRFWSENRDEAELDCEFLIVAVVAKPSKKATKKGGSAGGGSRSGVSSGGDASTIATTEDHPDDGKGAYSDEDALDHAKKRGKREYTHVQLLPPEVYRLSQADKHCSFQDSEDAATVKAEFDIVLDSFDDLRDRVVKGYTKLYPQRIFGDDAMYVQVRSNAKAVFHLDNLATALAKVNSRGFLRITMSATQTADAGEEGYERDDNGHILAPVLPTEGAKTAAAKASKELAVKVEATLVKLYLKESSPFHYGFNKSHAVFIKQHLLTNSAAAASLLLQLESNTFPTDMNIYLSPLYKTWANQLILNQTKSLPEKGRFPPDGNGGIPERDLNAPTTTNPSGTQTGGTGGTVPPVSVATALLAVAGAVERGRGDVGAAKRGGGVMANENHINEWHTPKDFFTHITLDEGDATQILAAGFNTVMALHEAVDEANKADSFLKALQEYIPGLSAAACFKIRGGSKTAPSPP